MNEPKVRVWYPLVRFGHWALIASRAHEKNVPRARVTGVKRAPGPGEH